MSVLNKRDVELLEICLEEGCAKWQGSLPDWRTVGERLGRSNNSVGKQYRRIEKRCKKADTSIETELYREQSQPSGGPLSENVVFSGIEGDEVFVPLSGGTISNHMCDDGILTPLKGNSIHQTLIDSVYNSSGVDRNRYEVKIKRMWGNPESPQASYDIVPKPLPDNYDEIFETLSTLDFSFDIPKHNDTGELMALFSMADLHISKLGVDGTGHIETIAGYKKTVEKLVGYLVNYDIGKICWILGNDLVHANIHNTTTAGTPQSTSIGFFHAFDLAAELALWTVNILSQVAKVHVISIPGNHDTASDFAIGRIVKHAFGDRIEFDESYEPRKYLQHRRVGIQLGHGDGEKPADRLPLFITEAPLIFANTDLRISFTAHLHGLKTTVTTISENHGFIQRTLPSLSGVNDTWHTKKGYVGNNAMGIVHIFGESEQIGEFYAHP